MESGAFICIYAIAIELLIFLVTITYIVIRTLRGGVRWTNRLWWPVGASALAGAIAFVFSFVYSRDNTWYLVVAGIIALPLVLAMAVTSRRRLG
jgi:hypothetical protein